MRWKGRLALRASLGTSIAWSFPKAFTLDLYATNRVGSSPFMRCVLCAPNGGIDLGVGVSVAAPER